MSSITYSCEWVEKENGIGVQCVHCGLKSCSAVRMACRNQESKENRPILVQVTKVRLTDPRSARITARTRIVRDHLKCAFIGAMFDDEVEVKNCGCSSAKGFTHVWECTEEHNVNRECVPLGEPKTEPIMACKNCNHYRHKDE